VTSKSTSLPSIAPHVGSVVELRSRRWLVEDVTPPHHAGDSALVRLACAEEDAQGETLEVYWDYELDRRVLDEERWEGIGAKGFDDRSAFAAFLHTLRWGCVTATDPTLFQSPFRAGIQIDAYQMEPLRKALQLPRVNLFIADDTGLGKTIEAGLIAQELLLRKKVKHIVVSAPPSVLDQWRMELEERFGLLFEILDRDYLARVRRERGFGVNPWHTHSRFLISHNLLIDDTYAGPMREWLDDLRREDEAGLRPGSLLILDEAHHAAPASGTKYGIETKFTRAVRDLAWRFEHRLFLSATPHNGHSSSFSTLLELLDPTRFTRGVPIKGKKDLEAVMVRRIKEDIRSVQSGFPKRHIVPIRIDGLPEETPELVLSSLLDEYRELRDQRHSGSSKRAKAAAGLLVVGLQQRLLSSIEAFARSLKVHTATVERQWKMAHDGALPSVDELDALFVDQHDEEIETVDDASEDLLTDEEIDQAESDEEERELTTLEAAAEEGTSRDEALFARERALLARMKDVAETHRYSPDVKMQRLFTWLRENLCPGLPKQYGDDPEPEAEWNNRRVLIFTENRQGTKVRLREVLATYIADTKDWDRRIAVLDGTTPSAHRKEIQRRFNADPREEPLRILIATDAAREGLNLQAHCADLFHFDLPWNPSRLEQRNGRIDRKLQPAAEVRCHYFVLPQRVEDRVLEVLVAKTERIQKELGSLSKVIEVDLEKLLKHGIRHRDADALKQKIEDSKLEEERRRIAEEEFEVARERREDLQAQIERCRELLEKSERWANFKPAAFREALSCSLRLQDLRGLEPTDPHGKQKAWVFPSSEEAQRRDPSWKTTLDSLRTPRKPKQRLADWRREAPIRPVVFEDAGTLQDDTVHLHLQQRLAQRLLARFRSQGFRYHDLSRACLAQSRDAIPRVVLLGRLALYGINAERLHEEIIPVAARWKELDDRNGPLKAYARDAETNTLQLLEDAMSSDAPLGEIPTPVRERLEAATAADVADLRPQLEPRAEELAKVAEERLRQRGEKEASDFLDTLRRQRVRVEKELERFRMEEERIRQEKSENLFGLANREENEQLREHARSWLKRLAAFDEDERDEPARIRARYEVRATRVEPVGLVYLWPRSN
jgi:superfamily II DNA/RNA helicase